MDTVGCWKVIEQRGNDLVCKWIDIDGLVVKTEQVHKA